MVKRIVANQDQCNVIGKYFVHVNGSGIKALLPKAVLY